MKKILLAFTTLVSIAYITPARPMEWERNSSEESEQDDSFIVLGIWENKYFMYNAATMDDYLAIYENSALTISAPTRNFCDERKEFFITYSNIQMPEKKRINFLSSIESFKSLPKALQLELEPHKEYGYLTLKKTPLCDFDKKYENLTINPANDLDDIYSDFEEMHKSQLLEEYEQGVSPFYYKFLIRCHMGFLLEGVCIESAITPFDKFIHDILGIRLGMEIELSRFTFQKLVEKGYCAHTKSLNFYKSDDFHLKDFFTQETAKTYVNLIEINLSSCELKELPDGLRYFTKLSSIDVSCNPSIKSLPEWLCTLENLSSLNINGCDFIAEKDIEFLQKKFSNLKILR